MTIICEFGIILMVWTIKLDDDPPFAPQKIDARMRPKAADRYSLIA